MKARLSDRSLANDWPKCVPHLSVFAKDGLRTLVLAQKDISQKEYDEWAREYYEAELATEDRDDKLDLVADKIERGFTCQCPLTSLR